MALFSVMLCCNMADGATLQPIITGTEGEYRWAHAVGIVHAPVGAVWKTLTDYDNSEEFMPNIEEAVVVSRQGLVALVRNRVKAGPLHRSFIVKTTIEKEGSFLSWRLYESNDFRRNDGYWKLTPLPGKRTRLEYKVGIEFRKPMPEWLATILLKRSIPDAFGAVELRAQQL